MINQELIDEISALKQKIQELEQSGFERKQAAALHELKVKIGEQELYHILVEMASDGIWLLDKKFMTVYVNPAMEEMLGYAKEEMIGRSWYDFGDPEWVARAKELEKRRESGVKEPHSFLFIHKDGRKVMTRISTTPLYDQDGNFNGALGILSDITRQKEVEEALRESQENYRNLIENANEAIFVAQDGKLVFINPMTSMMIGYSGEDLMSGSFVEYIHLDDRDMVMDRHVRRIKGEELPHIYSFRIIRGDGNVIWVELNTVVVNWKRKPATLNFLTDITERKRAEEALRESEGRSAISLRMPTRPFLWLRMVIWYFLIR